LRAIKFAVIAMGILLVAGFVVLVIGFIQLAAPSASSDQPIHELSISQTVWDRLDVPASSRIVSIASIQNGLLILVETVDGEQRLFTVDPDVLLAADGDD